MSPKNWEKKKWKDLSDMQKAAIILVGIVQFALLAAALVDIQKRAPEEINGNKNAWRLWHSLISLDPSLTFCWGARGQDFLPAEKPVFDCSENLNLGEACMSITPRVGVYVCHCGVNISATVDIAAVTRYATHLPGVVIARDYTYMCSDPGQALIKNDIIDLNLNRVVVSLLLAAHA